MPKPVALALVLVPFGVFFACCLGQFWLSRRVRRALARRHPEVWRDISAPALFIDNAVMTFAWRRRDRALGDPELTREVMRLRTVFFIAMAAWLALVVQVVTGHGAVDFGEG